MLSTAAVIVGSASISPQAAKTRGLLGPLQVALGIARDRETRICLSGTDLWRHQATKDGACCAGPRLNHGPAAHE